MRYDLNDECIRFLRLAITIKYHQLSYFIYYGSNVRKYIGKAMPDSHNDVVVVALVFYVHGKYLRSCRDGQLT